MKTRIVSIILLLLIIFQFPNIPLNDENSKLNNPHNRDFTLEKEPSPFSLSSTRAGGVTFTNVTPLVGLDGIRGDSYAWGDYNNDGFLDLLVKDHVNGKSHLFENNGPPAWDFTDVTNDVGLEGAGYSIWGDYNNDGYLDFFSVGQTNDDPDGAWDTLWMNQGPPDYKFANMTGPAGNLNDGMPGLAAGWADYDRDGFLDLYVVNWRDLDNIRYPDVLYHNNCDGTFSDVTTQAGVWEGDDPYAGMGMNWGDYNNDGWPDIYVSNYLVMPNYLYENNQDGTFTNVAFDKNAAGDAPADEYYGHTAGSSWSDYDHDGDLDMWVTNLAHTTDPRGFYTDYSQMLRNNGPPDYDFTDVRDQTGIEKKPYMSEDELHFGIAWGDYDNDGDYDMFIPQVKNVDYAFSYFFENNGDGTFTDVSDAVGVKVWNTDGACWADYNNDGYIDLITEGKESFENGTYQVRLFRNNGESGNTWLEVELESSQSNFASIGARVKVSYNGITMMKEIEGGTAGHAYQPSMIQHFGFGDYQGTVNITAWWPSGREIFWEGVALNQKITIREFDYDLRVSHVYLSDPMPGVGDTVTIFATIDNMGNNAIDYAKINFFDGGIGGTLIGSQSLHNIAQGDEILAFTSWDTTDLPGEHTIFVSIEDPTPSEEYTANNHKSLDVIIYDPDPGVLEIKFSDNQPDEGDTVTIFADIKNHGYIEMESAKIKIFDSDINSQPIKVVDIFNLLPQEMTSVEVNWDTSGKLGNHDIIVTIENVHPMERNTDNNQRSKSIEVVKENQSEPPVVNPNNPPEIIEVTVEPSTIMIGESCTISVLAIDEDDDTLTYSYDVNDGIITGFGSTVIWNAPGYQGTFEISVTVSDNIDEIEENITVEVKANAPPFLDNIKISPDAIYNSGDETILITCEVSDENGLEDINKVRIDLRGIEGSSKNKMYDDGTFGDKEAGDGIYSLEVVVPKGITPGEKVLVITAIDKSDGEFSQDITILILESESEGEDFFMSNDILLYLSAFILIGVCVIVIGVLLKKNKNQGKFRPQ
jgi:hypothetical protein